MILLGSGGTLIAAEPDLVGTWKMSHPKGQTTLVVSQAEGNFTIRVEGRNFLLFDELTFVPNGEASSVGPRKITATLRDDRLVTRFEPGETGGKKKSVNEFREFTWSRADETTLELTVFKVQGKARMLPKTHIFVLRSH